MLRIPQCYQLFVGLPHIAGYFLVDLKTFFGIYLDALQVAHHDADDQILGKFFVGTRLTRAPKFIRALVMGVVLTIGDRSFCVAARAIGGLLSTLRRVD